MQLIRFIIVYSALIMKICPFNLTIGTSNLDESRLIEATVYVLEICYIDRVSTIGLIGDSAGSISKTLSLRETDIAVILIDDTPNVVNNGSDSRVSRHRLPVVVVTVTNFNTLAKTLTKIKSSVWWNHEASFIFIDWSAAIDGCSNAYEILWEAWKMNILDSNFMCFDQTRKRLIYTFNPYTNKAPLPWQLESTYKGIKNHIWTLFVQVYRKEEDICETLNFDKTTDLGGYEIHATVKGMDTWWYADPNKTTTTFNRVQNVTAQILISSINASWKFTVYPEADFQSVNDKEKPSDEVADIYSGIADICLNSRNRYFWMHAKSTYQFKTLGVAILTQRRGHMSQVDKILSVLDVNSRIGQLLVYLITLLFFKCYLGNPLMPAILNLVLVVCNASLSKIPKTLASRIYLGSLFIFALTIQGIYQGKLASLLTKQVPLSNVNNIQDLGRFGHKIYGHALFYPWFNESTFRGRFVPSRKVSCTEYVLRDSNAACLTAEYTLNPEAVQSNLHLSQEMILYFQEVYLIRADWPLEKRVHSNLQACVESNIIDTTISRNLRSTMHIFKFHKDNNDNDSFKVIILDELSFAFVILGIGLGCATISLIIEIGINRSKVMNPRNHIHRRTRRNVGPVMGARLKTLVRCMRQTVTRQ